MSTQSSPLVSLLSPELLRELDKLYPDKCPDLSMTDREVWVAVGNRQVVSGLLTAWQEAHTDNIVLSQ